MEIFKNLFYTHSNHDNLSPLPVIILLSFNKHFPNFVLHRYMHIFLHDNANFMGTVVNNHWICGHILSLCGHLNSICLGICFLKRFKAGLLNTSEIDENWTTVLETSINIQCG